MRGLYKGCFSRYYKRKEDKDMSIYGIGSAGYPMAGYEPRKTQRRNTAGNGTNQMGSVTQTSQSGSD